MLYAAPWKARKGTAERDRRDRKADRRQKSHNFVRYLWGKSVKSFVPSPRHCPENPAAGYGAKPTRWTGTISSHSPGKQTAPQGLPGAALAHKPEKPQVEKRLRPPDYHRRNQNTRFKHYQWKQNSTNSDNGKKQ